MYAPIRAPDDEDEERNDVVRRCKEPVQESLLTYYNHKCIDFACSNAVSSNPLKISYERLIQEGFDLASPKAKTKKRKSEAVDGGGGRVIRAAGRKDRHSKVRTARGPRDRRLRLSPATAIQFYDVQDRLGCDRPSKAIDWLIKEAKAAIDAQSVKFSDSNAAEAGFSFSQRGMREKDEHLNDDDGLVSAFSSFVNEAAPPPAAAYLARDGSCSASNSAPQNLETNWEMGRLQKMFAWNSVNERGGGGGAEYFSGDSLPPHAAAQVTNLFREPLQSSIINHTWMNNDLVGFNFSNELSKIAASAHHQD